MGFGIVGELCVLEVILILSPCVFTFYDDVKITSGVVVAAAGLGRQAAAVNNAAAGAVDRCSSRRSNDSFSVLSFRK